MVRLHRDQPLDDSLGDDELEHLTQEDNPLRVIKLRAENETLREHIRQIAVRFIHEGSKDYYIDIFNLNTLPTRHGYYMLHNNKMTIIHRLTHHYAVFVSKPQ